jgi:hypothetical protein
MFPSRRTARIEFPILRYTGGMLILALAMGVPLAAQKPEQASSMQCDKTEAPSEHQKTLQANPQSSGTVALTCRLPSIVGIATIIQNIW